MKNTLKLIAAVVLLVITVQINAQEETGYVKILKGKDFKEQYIGSSNSYYLLMLVKKIQLLIPLNFMMKT